MKKQVAACVLALLLCIGAGGGPLAFSVSAARLNDYNDGQTGPYLNSYSYRGTASVAIGKTVDLKPYLIYYDSEDERYLLGAITWTTTHSRNATVDSNGIATGVKAGSTTIRASGHNNLGEVVEQTILLRVEDSRAAIKLPKAARDMSFTMFVNQNIDLSQLLPEASVSWTARTEKVAGVQKGVLHANAVGTTLLTGTYKDENGDAQSVTVEVQVRGDTERNEHRKDTITIQRGETLDLLAMFYPSLTSVSQTKLQEFLTVTSADNKTVSVQGFTVTGKSKGTCKVTLAYDEFARSGFRGNEVLTIRVVD